MEHQREQAGGFGLAGQQVDDEPAEPDRFLGEAPTPWIAAGHVLPRRAVRGIDRLEHRELVLAGHAGDGIVTLRQGMRTVEVADAVLESAATGLNVSLKASRSEAPERNAQ